MDAAADYLIIPNPYIAPEAGLVAYSGGKILRGANSAPHHAFGRACKVSKEEIIGILVAVETWVQKRGIQAEYREWESWYAHITERVADALLRHLPELDLWVGAEAPLGRRSPPPDSHSKRYRSSGMRRR